jgi:hypothetical protein
MAKQRIVNTHFWRDGFILGLKPDERLLFLWVITNPSTDLCGAYEAALPTIELETGLKGKRILEIFDQFAQVGKVVYRHGWVIVHNFTKHQNGTSTNVKKGAERSLNACPDWVKDTLSKGMYTDPNPTLPEPRPEPRPEPEPNGKREADTSPSAPPPKTKGTRLAEPFLLTAEMRAYAAAKRPEVDPVLETEKFCNYWRAKPGRDGTKLDWLATWRNWILNAKETHGTNQQHTRTSEREKSAQRGANAIALIDELRRQGELERQAVSGGGDGGRSPHPLALKPAESYGS